MRVGEIAPGLWRWTGHHPEWKREVGCAYVETRDGVCLIDPLVPPEDEERFLAALDRDVERAGGEVNVLLTIYWHGRSARRLVARYGARLWAHAPARAPVERRVGPPSALFRPGDPLPGRIGAFPVRGSEVAFWLPAHRALVFGDAVLGAEDGGLRLCPESWHPRGGGHARVRENLRPLLDLPVERVLVSHGEPVLHGGRRALEQLLGGA
ncbi:MAG: hypothetical protein C4306_00510 [Thermoleophilia bacterium]